MKEQSTGPGLEGNDHKNSAPQLTKIPRRATGDYNLATDPVNCLLRLEQTSIFRLRTGHCKETEHYGPPYPPGLFPIASVETPVMVARWDNCQRAVGSSQDLCHSIPVPGNMWTESLCTVGQPQKNFTLIPPSHYPDPVTCLTLEPHLIFVLLLLH